MPRNTPLWNYKSAIVSALCRAPIFFAANLPAGLTAAAGAALAELLFRFGAAGFYGALTQAFRGIEPPLAGTLAAIVVLPVLGHSGEFILHWWRATPHLGASLTASMAFTVVSTTFNLFAMRRGALITGQGSQSLWHDLKGLPALIGAFLLSWRSRPFI